MSLPLTALLNALPPGTAIAAIDALASFRGAIGNPYDCALDDLRAAAEAISAQTGLPLQQVALAMVTTFAEDIDSLVDTDDTTATATTLCACLDAGGAGVLLAIDGLPGDADADDVQSRLTDLAYTGPVLLLDTLDPALVTVLAAQLPHVTWEA